MGRPSNTAERQAQIVQGLLSVMARRGYQEATIGEIARSVGLTPGLLHYHFKSKHEILVALMVHLVEGLHTRIAKRREAAGELPQERLFAFVDAYVAIGEDADPQSVAAWVVVGTEAVRDSEVRQVYETQAQAALTELQKLVRAALKVEGRTTRSARQIAAAILSMIEGAYRLSAAAPSLLPRGFAAPMLRQAIDGLISAQEKT